MEEAALINVMYVIKCSNPSFCSVQAEELLLYFFLMVVESPCSSPPAGMYLPVRHAEAAVGEGGVLFVVGDDDK